MTHEVIQTEPGSETERIVGTFPELSEALELALRLPGSAVGSRMNTGEYCRFYGAKPERVLRICDQLEQPPACRCDLRL